MYRYDHYKKGGYNFTEVVDNWTKIVSKDISEKCYPTNIKVGKDMSNGVLALNVIHGKELDIEYNKKNIIDEINSFFGYNYIKEIRLKVVQETKNNKKSLQADKKMDKYNKKIDEIKNEGLKNSLTKLMEAFANKND